MAWPAWQDELDAERDRWPDTSEVGEIDGVNPNVLMHEVSAASGAAGSYVADVGQHQMWAAQSLEIGAHQRFLTSGGMGAMGSGLPLAIGVGDRRSAPGRADRRRRQLPDEHPGARRPSCGTSLPIKMVIVNNGCHGMVRQFQESYFDGRYPSTVLGYSAPSFAAVAAAYGIAAQHGATTPTTSGSPARLWRDPAAPGLLEVAVDTYANAYPKLAFGKPITEMEPFAKPIAMEGT